jgi:SAM-dependent methyltransferase
MCAAFTKKRQVNNYRYPGEELELFESAGNWKRYLAKKLGPYISGRVLEVGAGTGETTQFLPQGKALSWTCLEPDPVLLQVIERKIGEGHLPEHCLAVSGTLNGLPASSLFDTILYIDVLEHIEDDHKELALALSHLNEGGHLIVLSPAYQFLYSPFDKAIGHFRRYRKKTLRRAAKLPGLEERKMYYLESLGVGLLLLNRFIFRKTYPARKDIALWQRFLVPLSKVVDKILFYSVGKSIIGIWQHRRKQQS